MTVERALELIDKRLELCENGIEELRSIQNTMVGSVAQDVTKIPLEMLKHEIEDLKDIRTELQSK